MPNAKPVRTGNSGDEESQPEGKLDQHHSRCCTPRCCLKPTVAIDLQDPEDAVRVICNNDQCSYGNFMHRECFEEWEESVLTFLRSCGRARSWSEKQRLQNLWTKKGYDLAFKACDCRCAKGHLRKDLDYVLQPVTLQQNEDKKSKRSRRKSERPMVVMAACARALPAPMRSPLQTMAVVGRPHAASFSSTGSSPPRSASPLAADSSSGPDDDPASSLHVRRFSFCGAAADARYLSAAASGNIFCHRDNLSVFNCLPPHKRNGYHIKMEDEGPFVNDETRCFVLSNLSAHRAASVQCVVCLTNLVVYDRYPLIDGTFFLTPLRHGSSIVVATPSGGAASAEPSKHYISAVCMHCLHGSTSLCCRGCRRRWDGSALLLGTMYAYDVFAAQPCCQRRLQCRSCRRVAIDPARLPPYFSEYSRPLACQHCRSVAEHFVKSIPDVFYVRQPCS